MPGMTSSQTHLTDSVPKTTLAIIGAGFAGLGLAIRLKQEGLEDFIIFERAQDVGGVWRDNVYPGCACDVESYLYSLSFAPNPGWSRSFSGQAEIQAYLRELAQRFDLYRSIRLGHALEAANWDEQQQHWNLETTGGPCQARFLISATGAFSEPKIPALPGIADFQGKVFHSARWEKDFDLRGRKVAVIGTGASAIQFVPEIQPLVQKLTLFQRTPAWIMPRFDRPIGARQQALYRRFPLLMQLTRLKIYLQREFFGMGFRHPDWMALYRHIALRHLHQAIQDPKLRALLTPDYTIGCKRILLSNQFYPALAQPNVEVVSSAVQTLRPQSIVSSEGQEYEIDTLIFGTGFQVTEYAITQHIFGRSGQSLADVWRGSPAAYLGTMIPDFPNLFFLLGPNTGLGHSSVVLMIEAQIAFVLKAVQYLQTHQLTTLEPRPEQHKAYLQDLADRSRGTVWLSGGCNSWYLDSQGRNSTLWPASVGAYRRQLTAFQANAFRFS